jgi:2-oxoglutarate ferredoxin oxidoreductase subunit gamma
MDNRVEIRLSGTGGQGLILGGILLAEAAVLDGKEVVQTQSYGPEARGGASKAEVIISDSEIHYPKVVTPNYLLLMSQQAAKLYATTIAKDGLIIMDETLIVNLPEVEARVIRVPLTRLAKETIGNEMTANVLAVGALAAAGGIVSQESLEKAVRLRLPRIADINTKALKLGWEWGLK